MFMEKSSGSSHLNCAEPPRVPVPRHVWPWVAPTASRAVPPMASWCGSSGPWAPRPARSAWGMARCLGAGGSSGHTKHQWCCNMLMISKIIISEFSWRIIPCESTSYIMIWLWINTYWYHFLGGGTSIYQLFWCELQGYKVLTHCHTF